MLGERHEARDRRRSVAAWVGAALSSLCCLLPLAVIVLGLGSGAFMAVTMQYRWILIPAGVLGVVAGLILYVRERRRCNALACRMAGSRITLVLLIAAGLVVVASILLDRFPELTSDLLARVMESGGSHSGHQMGGSDESPANGVPGTAGTRLRDQRGAGGFDRHALRGGDDLRQLTRRGQKGPGRAQRHQPR